MSGNPTEQSESDAYMTEQILTYLGNKRTLLEFIGLGVAKVQRALGKERLDTFDVFSGSGVVARYLKRFSRKLVVCDLEQYSAVVNSCYLCNRSEIDERAIQGTIDRINSTANRELRAGFITELYAPEDDSDIQPGERVFYTRRNAMMIDTVRALIDETVPEEHRRFVMAPLLYVASVHANTSGVFKGFYKNSATGRGQFGGNGKDALARICRSFNIPAPIFSAYESEYTIHTGDSNTVCQELPTVDLAYVDPPYNQHPYGSNYFMLNLIAENVRPQEYSRVSGIPVDWNRSDYNKRQRARTALQNLVQSINARFLLISFNSEGFIRPDEMQALLSEAGRTETLETRYNTFRGSRNLKNRDIHVTEFLYLVDKRA